MQDAWDAYAVGNRDRPQRERNAAGEGTWFNWTQYPDHGPGAEVLGGPETVLELGCGTGRNIAHLAVLGAKAVGLDVSPVQIGRARQRFGSVPGLELACGEATEYLRVGGGTFDAIYSVFGAVWFTDPEVLLPLIAERLRPGGVLAFSHHPPIEGCYGSQGSYVFPRDGGKPMPLRRWSYTVDMWADVLAAHAFTFRQGAVIAAPDANSLETMLIAARR